MNDSNNETNSSLMHESEFIHERYLQLTDAYGQLQVQNSLLEERILTLVETYSEVKNQLEQELTDSKQLVIHLKDTINELANEKQQYKDNFNLAVELLHRNSLEFIPTTLENLQEQVEHKSELVSWKIIISNFC